MDRHPSLHRRGRRGDRDSRPEGCGRGGNWNPRQEGRGGGRDRDQGRRGADEEGTWTRAWKGAGDEMTGPEAGGSRTRRGQVPEPGGARVTRSRDRGRRDAVRKGREPPPGPRWAGPGPCPRRALTVRSEGRARSRCRLGAAARGAAPRSPARSASAAAPLHPRPPARAPRTLPAPAPPPKMASRRRPPTMPRAVTSPALAPQGGARPGKLRCVWGWAAAGPTGCAGQRARLLPGSQACESARTPVFRETPPGATRR